MYEWTQKRIEWYERAINRTGYDKALASALMPHLGDGDTVCDLGCGTGYLGLELARHGYAVSAVDISRCAMDCLSGKPESAKPGFEMLHSDWTDVADRRWDHVIMCLTGNFETELSYYLSLCMKNLIIIGKRKTRRYAGRRHPLENNHVRYDELRKILTAKGLEHTYKECSLEFGQPFKTLAEAEEYLQYFGAKGSDLTSAMKMIKTAEDPEYPYYLPYMKDMGICVVQKPGKKT